MNYKKIIKSQQFRFKILRWLRFVPDGVMLRVQYYIKMGRWPNLRHPKRFTEKLQVYKMKYRNPVMSDCVDKYEVRKYVAGKGLGNILNECYGVYDRVEDIDLNTLPDQFVAKITNGGGGLNVILVRNKNKLNIDDFITKLRHWNMQQPSYGGREWAYYGIKKSRIIIEELLIDNSNADGTIEDYKFFCFDGKVYCVQADCGRYTQHKRNLYTDKWEQLPVSCTYPNAPANLEPVNFEEMLRIVEILSSDFPFVRVDLYNIQGKIYFGELTYYPGSGYEAYTPDSFDFELGKYFTTY